MGIGDITDCIQKLLNILGGVYSTMKIISVAGEFLVLFFLLKPPTRIIAVNVINWASSFTTRSFEIYEHLLAISSESLPF